MAVCKGNNNSSKCHPAKSLSKAANSIPDTAPLNSSGKPSTANKARRLRCSAALSSFDELWFPDAHCDALNATPPSFNPQLRPRVVETRRRPERRAVSILAENRVHRLSKVVGAAPPVELRDSVAQARSDAQTLPVGQHHRTVRSPRRRAARLRALARVRDGGAEADRHAHAARGVGREHARVERICFALGRQLPLSMAASIEVQRHLWHAQPNCAAGARATCRRADLPVGKRRIGR
eukprot:1139901-Pleurochrysis_carterae.AAC.1